jgi:hypothetical protein
MTIVLSPSLSEREILKEVAKECLELCLDRVETKQQVMEEIT